MKSGILSVLALTLTLSLVGCGGAEDVIGNSSEPNLELRTSYGDAYLSYEIKENTLEVKGQLKDTNAKFVLLDYDETDEEMNVSAIEGDTFQINADIPDTKKDLTVNVFLGEEQYGEYEGILCDFVIIEKLGDTWSIKEAPVFAENLAIFNEDRDPNYSLVGTTYIQADNNEIVELSYEITKNCTSDYEKVLRIHDWVAENIYYDFTSFYSGNYEDSDAVSVLHSKKAVCEGYANLFAALTRAQDIPCAVRTGYALGIGTDAKWTKKELKETESNHAWNEAYVDGRWIIIDATWDSQNKLENGEMIKGANIDHIYFDADMEFFSLSHRIIEAE